METQPLPARQKTPRPPKPFRLQLLKWVGNKQRVADQIAAHIPPISGTYYEPFLGSGAVLGTVAPARAVASDAFAPLVEIWQTLAHSPELLKTWYADRWEFLHRGEKRERYEQIKAAYNARPNGADLLFLCRACYGGVVRFRRSDGHMSTPCGAHPPVRPENFARRVDVWRRRTAGTTFAAMDFEEAMDRAAPGDLVYCDPPYSFTQSILYGAQAFSLSRLLEAIARCQGRGVRVALSIDGSKKSGALICRQPIPEGLFPRELLVRCGRSMLRRFQLGGRTAQEEEVADRLLLSW